MTRRHLASLSLAASVAVGVVYGIQFFHVLVDCLPFKEMSRTYGGLGRLFLILGPVVAASVWLGTRRWNLALPPLVAAAVVPVLSYLVFLIANRWGKPSAGYGAEYTPMLAQQDFLHWSKVATMYGLSVAVVAALFVFGVQRREKPD